MKCVNHADVEAKWKCTACGRAFCEGCVKMLGGRGEHVAVCRVCGEKCEEAIEAPEAVATTDASFWEKLPGIVTYPLQKDGLIILILGTIFFAIAQFATRLVASFFIFIIVALLLWIVVTGYLWRYFFSVVCESSRGSTSPPTWPDLEPGSLFSESFGALLKFLGPAILGFGAAAAYYFLGPKEFDRTFFVLSALGCLYFPMALTAVAIFDDVSAANPIPIIRSIFRAPFRYLVTCVIFMGLLYLNYLCQEYLVISVFAIGSLIRWFVLLYLWTMAMHLLGMFYYTNRHKLQWA